MFIGYARVSTNDQDTAAQVAALKAAKCGKSRDLSIYFRKNFNRQSS